MEMPDKTCCPYRFETFKEIDKPLTKRLFG